jgi:hypothetical protein
LGPDYGVGNTNATDMKLMEMRRVLNQSEMLGGRKSKEMNKMAKSSEQVKIGKSSE